MKRILQLPRKPRQKLFLKLTFSYQIDFTLINLFTKTLRSDKSLIYRLLKIKDYSADAEPGSGDTQQYASAQSCGNAPDVRLHKRSGWKRDACHTPHAYSHMNGCVMNAPWDGCPFLAEKPPPPATGPRRKLPESTFTVSVRQWSPSGFQQEHRLHHAADGGKADFTWVPDT